MKQEHRKTSSTFLTNLSVQIAVSHSLSLLNHCPLLFFWRRSTKCTYRSTSHVYFHINADTFLICVFATFQTAIGFHSFPFHIKTHLQTFDTCLKPSLIKSAFIFVQVLILLCGNAVVSAASVVDSVWTGFTNSLTCDLSWHLKMTGNLTLTLTFDFTWT